jgi:chromate transport protein ChrA
MGFCIAFNHGGFLAALLFFVVWSLPGAIGMILLAHGVTRVSTALPSVVYALLSGLNAGTVGIIAVAATQLSAGAIKDKMTRLILTVGACAGLLYNALVREESISFNLIAF